MLEARVHDLERRQPPIFRAGQYNILAKYLGSNKEPWFLFDGLTNSSEDLERASNIAQKHRETDPTTGKYKNKGWPNYVNGILTREEINRVERRDKENFSWKVRAPKLIQVIQEMDADVLSLVEVDQYYEFFQAELDKMGMDSVWVKRPQKKSQDGCAVCWKRSKFELLAHLPFHYMDDCRGLKRDRSALFTLLKMRFTPGSPRLIFVSTHLARNPECKNQEAIRLRQAAQLMVKLKEFAKQHMCGNDVPVIVAGDWNAECLNEIRAVTSAFFALRDLKDSVHPLLLGSKDVPTRRTSFTLQRRSRIDYLMFSETFLRIKSVKRHHADNDLTIPNQEHPSDHLPIAADFEFPTHYEICKECARRFLISLLRGNMRRPMLADELKFAFEYFDYDGSDTCDAMAIMDGAVALGVTESDEDLNLCKELCCTLEGGQKASFLTFKRAYERSFVENLKEDDSFYTDLVSAFQFFDKDGNGRLSMKEISSALRSISPAPISDWEIGSIFARVDLNGDGKVELDEFVTAMVKVHGEAADAKK